MGAREVGAVSRKMPSLLLDELKAPQTLVVRVDCTVVRPTAKKMFVLRSPRLQALRRGRKT